MVEVRNCSGSLLVSMLLTSGFPIIRMARRCNLSKASSNYCVELSQRWLIKFPGFEMEPRDRSCLPNSFPKDIPGTCYFLHKYEHPGTDPSASQVKHIQDALKEFNIGQTKPGEIDSEESSGLT